MYTLIKHINTYSLYKKLTISKYHELYIKMNCLIYKFFIFILEFKSFPQKYEDASNNIINLSY